MLEHLSYQQMVFSSIESFKVKILCELPVSIKLMGMVHDHAYEDGFWLFALIVVKNPK